MRKEFMTNDNKQTPLPPELINQTCNLYPALFGGLKIRQRILKLKFSKVSIYIKL